MLRLMTIIWNPQNNNSVFHSVYKNRLRLELSTLQGYILSDEPWPSSHSPLPYLNSISYSSEAGLVVVIII